MKVDRYKSKKEERDGQVKYGVSVTAEWAVRGGGAISTKRVLFLFFSV